MHTRCQQEFGRFVWRIAGTAALTIGFIGCYVVSPDIPTVVVDLALTGSRAEILAIDPAPRAPLVVDPPRRQAPLLRYRLVGEAGELLAEGTAADPRAPQIYWGPDESEQPEDEGVLQLALPALPGELAIDEHAAGGWRPLARVALSPQGRRPQGLFDLGIDNPVQLWDHAPPERALNIAVLSEGYTESELGAFHDDVRKMLARFEMQPDFAAHIDDINIWRVDVRSSQSGIDDPGAGTRRSTAFDIGFEGGFGYDTTSWWSRTKVRLKKHRVRRLIGHSLQAYALLVNSDVDSASAMGDMLMIGRATREKGTTLAHELGHVVLNLADEYTAGRACHPERVAYSPNVSRSADRDHLPWADLVAEDTPLPTSAYLGLTGAYEGGMYCNTGVYRPEPGCLMNQTMTAMCSVCRRELDRLMGRLTGKPYVWTPDKTPPTVRITEPADGRTVTSRWVTVTAVVDDDRRVGGIQLMVNGVNKPPKPVSSAGATSAFTMLEPGRSTLRLMAYDAAGNRSYDEVTVELR